MFSKFRITFVLQVVETGPPKIRDELRQTGAGRLLSGRVAEGYRELVSSRGWLRLVGDLVVETGPPKIRDELRQTGAGRLLSGRVAEGYRELVSSRGWERLKLSLIRVELDRSLQAGTQARTI
ncbi:hypothetical protein DY000_02015080 [Brassica cretica]|uniref:Uncharacterized protein n=1 Tax=Brassica cretica TaxID=69181 RepID=A0ABQ7CWP8_BRACR|nr:hypothetical protein DY000_02015080 [Brassica cretica]